VQYDYKPRLLAKEAERLDNPLGFLVTAYRTDQELAAPVAQTAGARQ
jgi:type IV secretion system protein VirB8